MERQVSGGGVEVIDKKAAERDELVGFIARTCHEVNRAYCQFIGDDSQVPFDQAPAWQRESAMHGVEAILANPNITPEQSHEGWMREKAEAGWRYGAVKDVQNKRHPCFVPYDELPETQRLKDYLFGAVVRSLSPLLA